jgi:predicted nucleic acid-binding protein
MIVVADSSPFILLLNIGHIEVLPQLFERVVIPPAVAAELLAPSRPQSVRDFITARPAWLAIQRPTTLQQIPQLHPGESEALSLAIEIHADLILIDERTAYREAVARNLNAIGTIRVLERAAAQGLLDLKDAFQRVKQTDFWIPPQFLDQRLLLHDKLATNQANQQKTAPHQKKDNDTTHEG